MRRSGKTTRAVDDAIQRLFTIGEIWILKSEYLEKYQENLLLNYNTLELKQKVVYDYDWKGNNMQRIFYDKIKKRLDNEHSIEIFCCSFEHGWKIKI